MELPAGFKRLWTAILDHATLALEASAPLDVAELRQVLNQPGGGIEGVINEGLRRNLTAPSPALLEFALAYVQSLQRLVDAAAFAKRLRESEVTERNPQLVDLVISAWWIYLQAHAESACRFVSKALGVLVGDDQETQRMIAVLQEARQRVSRSVADLRRSVTHAEPIEMREATKTGLWLPMVLDHELADPLGWIHERREQVAQHFLEAWEGRLRESTGWLLAFADQECEEAAKLIETRSSS